MRRATLSVLAFAAQVACAKQEEQKPDSAAMAVAPAPAALTDAAVAGTWTGTSITVPGDSVIAHFTEICGNGSCAGTSTEAPKDTTHATYTLSADSSIGITTPFAFPGTKGNVVDHWVARPKGNSIE